MHNYCSNLHMNSVIDRLMCVVFEQNCVKLNTFSILHLLMQVLCTQFTTILALSFFYMGSLHYTYIEPRGNPWPCVFTVLVAITLKWKINPDWPKNLYELDTIQFVRHYYIVQFMTIYNMSIRYATF